MATQHSTEKSTITTVPMLAINIAGWQDTQGVEEGLMAFVTRYHEQYGGEGIPTLLYGGYYASFLGKLTPQNFQEVWDAIGWQQGSTESALMPAISRAQEVYATEVSNTPTPLRLVVLTATQASDLTRLAGALFGGGEQVTIMVCGPDATSLASTYESVTGSQVRVVALPQPEETITSELFKTFSS